MSAVRIGLVGFGQVGRQIFRLALDNPRYEVVAISELGRPEILHRLLARTMTGRETVRLEANYLVSPRAASGGKPCLRTRLLPAGVPSQIPWWDVFGVDLVIDATGQPRSSRQLIPHLENGAGRVFLSTPPTEEIDRVVLFGVNQDRIVSAGSASTTAMALALKVIGDAGSIEHATMTSVHAYTSDQNLQDRAGPDYRRRADPAPTTSFPTCPRRPTG